MFIFSDPEKETAKTPKMVKLNIICFLFDFFCNKKGNLLNKADSIQIKKFPEKYSSYD